LCRLTAFSCPDLVLQEWSEHIFANRSSLLHLFTRPDTQSQNPLNLLRVQPTTTVAEVMPRDSCQSRGSGMSELVVGFPGFFCYLTAAEMAPPASFADYSTRCFAVNARQGKGRAVDFSARCGGSFRRSANSAGDCGRRGSSIVSSESLATESRAWKAQRAVTHQ